MKTVYVLTNKQGEVEKPVAAFVSVETAEALMKAFTSAGMYEVPMVSESNGILWPNNTTIKRSL